MLGLRAVVVAAGWQNTFFVYKIWYLICMQIHYTKGLKPTWNLVSELSQFELALKFDMANGIRKEPQY